LFEFDVMAIAVMRRCAGQRCAERLEGNRLHPPASTSLAPIRHFVSAPIAMSAAPEGEQPDEHGEQRANQSWPKPVPGTQSQKKTFVLDFSQASSLDDAYNVINAAIGFAQFDLDAFVDILRGGFGHFEYGEEIKVRAQCGAV